MPPRHLPVVFDSPKSSLTQLRLETSKLTNSEDGISPTRNRKLSGARVLAEFFWKKNGSTFCAVEPCGAVENVAKVHSKKIPQHLLHVAARRPSCFRRCPEERTEPRDPQPVTV